MIDPFWLGVLVTLAALGAFFSIAVLTFLAWFVIEDNIGSHK